MKKQTFIQKHGGYIIDYGFCIMAVIAVILHYVKDEDYTIVLAPFALYAFVVTRRFKYLRNQFLAEINARDKLIDNLRK